MQRETKDSSARDPAALRETGCHRCALPAVLSSSPTWLGSPEPPWDRESLSLPRRHRKLSFSYRCRGPPSSPAVENEERGGGGPRAGRFLPPSQPWWDCRGPLCPTSPAHSPRRGCAPAPPAAGRVRRAGPGAAASLAGPGGAAPRRGAEWPSPAQPSPPRSPQPGSSVFVLKGRPSSSLRDVAARRGSRRKGPRLFGMQVFGRGEGEGKKKEEWGDGGCLPPFAEPRARASPEVRAAPRGFAPPLPACGNGLSAAARMPPGAGRAGAEGDASPPANAPAGCLQPRPALSSPCSREPLRLTVLIKLPSPSVGNSELSPSHV